MQRGSAGRWRSRPGRNVAIFVPRIFKWVWRCTEGWGRTKISEYGGLRIMSRLRLPGTWRTARPCGFRRDLALPETAPGSCCAWAFLMNSTNSADSFEEAGDEDRGA